MFRRAFSSQIQPRSKAARVGPRAPRPSDFRPLSTYKMQIYSYSPRENSTLKLVPPSEMKIEEPNPHRPPRRAPWVSSLYWAAFATLINYNNDKM